MKLLPTMTIRSLQVVLMYYWGAMIYKNLIWLDLIYFFSMTAKQINHHSSQQIVVFFSALFCVCFLSSIMALQLSTDWDAFMAICGNTFISFKTGLKIEFHTYSHTVFRRWVAKQEMSVVRSIKRKLGWEKGQILSWIIVTLSMK